MPIPAPRTVVLTEDLQAVVARWRAAPDRAARERIYAEALAEGYAPRFAELPLHGGVAGQPRPRALVSLVGHAWQPAALMAAWVRPERLLLLRTREPATGAPSALELVSRLSGLSLDRIEHQWVLGGGELAVYEEIRDFLARGRLKPDELAIDVTGGKKSMAVAAALAGFLAGARLLYVDYLEVDRGTPVPGTEYPRLLANPLSILGEIDIDRIREAFDGGHYLDAERRAEDLARRLYEPWTAEALGLLAQGYGAWHRFDFERARSALGELRTLLDARGNHAGAAWVGRVRPVLDGHLARLDGLLASTAKPDTIAQGMPGVLNHLAAASRALAQEDLDDATLLLYATVERYVDLCLWVDAGLTDRDPDYGRLAGRLDLERYRDLGSRLFEGPPPDRPHGPLLYLSAVLLLATLVPERLPEGELGWARGLGRMRNELVHGLVPTHPGAGEVASKLARVKGLLASAAGGAAALDAELAALRFPEI